MINSRIEKIDWLLIDSLGKLRFSKSSYYYLVIIPILVKVTEYLDNPFILSLGDKSFKLNLELPFSWYMFYFGAIFIALGTIIYQLFCPNFIKKFQNYGQFLEDGKHDEYLFTIKSTYAKDLSNLGFDFSKRPYTYNRKHKIDIMDTEPGEYKINVTYESDRQIFFNRLHEKVAVHNKHLIYFAFTSYTIGFFFFLLVIIQNIIFVIKHLF